MYPVNEIFQTVQGEAHFTGTPSVFVRLQGCDVGCPWCLAPETPVRMADWSEKPLGSIAVGDFVLGYRDSGYIAAKVLDTTARAGVPRVAVRTEDGRVIVATADHVFNTNHRRSASGRRKMEAGSLTNEDWLRCSRHTPKVPVEDDGPAYRRGYLKGSFLGDGGTSTWGGYRKLYWQVIDRDFAEFVCTIVNEHGRNCNVTEDARRTKAGKPVYRVSCSWTGLEWIFDLPNEDEEPGFVAGFFDAEGSVDKRGAALTISQLDEKPLKRVGAMILKHGLATDLRLLGNGMSALYISGAANVSRFLATFRPKIERKGARVFTFGPRDLGAVRVEGVVPAEVGPVTNLMTSSGNFFAAGVLVDQCDTKYTWPVNPTDRVGCDDEWRTRAPGLQTYAMLSANELVAEVDRFEARHVVFTGGEPCVYDLTEPTARLDCQGYSVQIETSGTQEVRASPDTWVTVSPKIGMPGGFAVRADALMRANEIKMPVGKPDDIEALLDLLEGAAFKPRPTPVWLQPLSMSPKATALCIAEATKRGWLVSFQVHGLVGLR